MIAQNRIARAAMVAVFALSIASCMMAQQDGTRGTGSETAIGQVAKDPNLPGLPSPPNAPIQWVYYRADIPFPVVRFTGTLTSYSFANYLGFNDEGSWLLHPDNGKVYVWNLKNFTLKEKFEDVAKISKNIFASLRNQMFEYTEMANRGRERDPNMPVQQNSPPEFPIQWLYGGDPTTPSISFKGLLANQIGQFGEYLGFNDEGSWLVHPDNGKIYVWDLKTLSLKERYGSFKDIPLETFASLRNPGGSTEGVLARNSKPGKKPATPVVAGNNPPPPSNNGAAIFGNDARKALQGVSPASGGVPAVDGAGFNGTGASIKGGVLTFTLADGTKSKPYKVVRPAVMMDNPQAASAGITGTWLALADGGKGMMFTVMGDNTVTGKEMPAALVQMLMQGGAQQ